MKNLYLKYVLALLKDVIKSIELKGIAEIIIIIFVWQKENAAINIKKFGLRASTLNANVSQ